MKDDFDTYSLFGGDAAGGAAPREPAKRSSLRAVRPASPPFPLPLGCALR